MLEFDLISYPCESFGVLSSESSLCKLWSILVERKIAQMLVDKCP